MSKSFPCSCGGEHLHLEWDVMSEDIVTLSLSIWKPHSQNKTSWRQRLRHIWRILRTGDPYGDQVLLDKPTVDAMVTYLQNVPTCNPSPQQPSLPS